MEFDRVFYKAVSEKFKYEESDHDFSDSDGWVDYYATENVPETAVNPLAPEDGEVENMSSIEINIFDTDVKISHHDSTMVPYGDTYVEYEPAGWGIDDVDCELDVRYTWEGDNITREQYLEINKMSDDELKAMVKILEGRAKDNYIDWIEENYEPPEPSCEDYDDYDDRWE